MSETASTLSYPLTDKDRRTRAATHSTNALARAMTRNSWLTLGLFAMGAAFAGNAYLTRQTMQAVTDLREHPAVIRVSDVGRADIVRPRGFDYHPEDAELIKALGTFVELHYRRIRAILLDQELGYGASLLSVDERLAPGIEKEDRRQNWIDDFMAGKTSEFVATSDENDVVIDNVVVRSFETRKDKMPIGTATVTYHETFYSSDQNVTGRKDFEEQIAFTFSPKITPSMYMTNPLGLVITYFKPFESLRKQG